VSGHNSMKITKHHGLGNDFLICVRPEVPANAAELARELCERRTGIGADGLIFGVDDPSVESNIGFVLFNADGSRPEVSGNGLRCFGQAIAMDRGVTELDIIVGSPAGPKHIQVFGPAGSETSWDIEVDMGAIVDGPSLAGRSPARHLPANRSLSLDIGNPHVVIEVDDPWAFEMAEIGPLVEADFPDSGINVHLVQWDTDHVTMNIWERGAGVTQACGSGACVAAAAAQRWGWFEGEQVQVHMPGGQAQVNIGSSVRLRGPAVLVAAMEVQRG